MGNQKVITTINPVTETGMMFLFVEPLTQQVVGWAALRLQMMHGSVFFLMVKVLNTGQSITVNFYCQTNCFGVFYIYCTVVTTLYYSNTSGNVPQSLMQSGFYPDDFCSLSLTSCNTLTRLLDEKILTTLRFFSNISSTLNQYRPLKHWPIGQFHHVLSLAVARSQAYPHLVAGVQ